MNPGKNGWEESDQYVPVPPSKTPRHLHWWIGLALCILVLAGFALQTLWSSPRSTTTGTPASQSQSPEQELAQTPPIARLKDLINHQKAESPNPAVKPKPHSVEEIAASRLQRLEAEKQQAVVASSHMLAINRTLVAAISPPTISSPRPNLLPGGVSPVPAGLADSRSVLPVSQPGGAPLSSGVAGQVKGWMAQTQPAPENTAPRPRNLTPLTPTNPVSNRMVFEGSLIPAVLLTQITSDLPGMITAQVTEDVYDSLYGSFLAIPKGSRLIGEYASHVVTGQERIMASFHRLILPHGQSFNLDAMQSADPVGQSGMQDEVDNRFWKRLGGQFMTAGIARILTPSGGGITILGGSGNTLGLDAAGQILVDTTRTGFQNNASLGPVIVIKKGYPFVIMVNQDMDFASVIP